MRFCGKIAIASFRTLEFAEFKAELRNRLGAKRCGCSEGVLILLTIFEWEVRHHALPVCGPQARLPSPTHPALSHLLPVPPLAKSPYAIQSLNTWDLGPTAVGLGRCGLSAAEPGSVSPTSDSPTVKGP